MSSQSVSQTGEEHLQTATVRFQYTSVPVCQCASVPVWASVSLLTFYCEAECELSDTNRLNKLAGAAVCWCQYSVDQIKNQSYKLSLTVRGMLGLDWTGLAVTPWQTPTTSSPRTSTLSPPLERRGGELWSVYWSLPPCKRLILRVVWSVWSLAAPLQAALVAHAFIVGPRHSTIPPPPCLRFKTRQQSFSLIS